MTDRKILAMMLLAQGLHGAALAAGQAAAPTPLIAPVRSWNAHQPLYRPRLDFLEEINAWIGHWAELFPGDPGNQSGKIQRLREELRQFKDRVSQGMTVRELDRSKAAFRTWRGDVYAELYSSNLGVQRAYRSPDSFIATMERAAGVGAKIRALTDTVNASGLDWAFERRADHRGETPEPRLPTVSAAGLGGPRTESVSGLATEEFRPPVPQRSRPASAAVPPGPGAPLERSASQSPGTRRQAAGPAAEDPSETRAASLWSCEKCTAIVRAIKDAAAGFWDRLCLRHVWDALTRALGINERAVLGESAESAHRFIKAVRKDPALLRRMGLAEVRPFDDDGRLRIRPGMSLFFDADVCGFHPRHGHGEIVTEVDPNGVGLPKATSSATQYVRLSCLTDALKSGRALVAMPLDNRRAPLSNDLASAEPVPSAAAKTAVAAKGFHVAAAPSRRLVYAGLAASVAAH